MAEREEREERTPQQHDGSERHDELSPLGGFVEFHRRRLLREDRLRQARRQALRLSGQLEAATPSRPSPPSPRGSRANLGAIVHPNLAAFGAQPNSPGRGSHRRSSSRHTVQRSMTANGPTQNFPSEPGSYSQYPRSTSSSNTTAQGQQQQNGGPQAMNATNTIPTNAGYSMDLNFLMQKVTELSAQLQINREQSSAIVGQVAEVRRRAAATGVPVTLQQINGELNGTYPDHDPQVQTLRQENEHMHHELRETRSLLSTYENAITDVTEMVRRYAFSQTNEKTRIHNHYHEELTRERQVSMELRQEQEEVRGRLRIVLDHLRKVQQEQADNDVAKEEQIAYWKHEAVQLRKIVFAESYRQGLDVMDGEGEEEGVTSDKPEEVDKVKKADDNGGDDQDDSGEKQ